MQAREDKMAATFVQKVGLKYVRQPARREKGGAGVGAGEGAAARLVFSLPSG